MFYAINTHLSHWGDSGFTYSMYIMTPMAQQSTGRPYRCLPTTSGAASKNTLSTHWSKFLLIDMQILEIFDRDASTEILWSPTGVLDEAIFKFCQLEVADDYFGVLQAIKVHQVLQLNVLKDKDCTQEVVKCSHSFTGCQRCRLITFRFLWMIFSECR